VAAVRGLLAGGALTLAAISPAAAQSYNTDALVRSDAGECSGVPACISDTKPPVDVPARGRSSARFACLASHPNLWNWDVAQHEHLSVELVAVDRSTVTIRGVNLGDIAGQFIVSLGCSTEPYAGNGFLKSRHLAPTGWLGR
jgi:hypothetical protein